MTPGTPRETPARQFFAGVGLVGRGLGTWATAPGIMLRGIIPALIVGAVYLTAIILLLVNADAVGAWSTPFAAQFDEPLRTVVRSIATLALLGLAGLLVVFTFTAATLAIGDPFYEQIWRRVEDRLGGVEHPVEPGFWRGIRDSVAVFLPAALFGVLLFAGGFIPVAGQLLVPIGGTILGGWFLALELTGRSFDSRGLSLRERRRMLHSRRALTLGFGCTTYLLFLIPFGAIVMMPAAVAGATILSRTALGLPTTPPPTRGEEPRTTGSGQPRPDVPRPDVPRPNGTLGTTKRDAVDDGAPPLR